MPWPGKSKRKLRVLTNLNYSKDEYIEPIRTLLVEDDPDLVDIAMELLELSGCKVTSAISPEGAMKILASTTDFELLFTDYRFPSVLTGIDLADQIKTLIPNIKVIIATGFDQETIQAKADPSYKVIYKPYRLEALKDEMRKMFSPSVS